MSDQRDYGLGQVAERGQRAEDGVFAVLDGVVESDWQERVFDWMSD